MPWYFPWSDSIKKRACRYLLQRYLGHFFEEKLTLEQLSVDLYHGTGSLRQLPLDVWALNELLESVSAPLEITEGFVGSISVSIPWSALLNENSTVEVRDLEIVLRPRARAGAAESLYWSTCMTSSMQLAQECLKQQPGEEGEEDPVDTPQPFEGLEVFAQTIETVLRRVRVSFINTTLRIEHCRDIAKTGLALEVRIKRMEYHDEAANEPAAGSDYEATPVNVHQPAAFAHKVLQVTGLSFFFDEFPDDEIYPRTTDQDAEPKLSPSWSPRLISEPHPQFSRTSGATVTSDPIQIGNCAGRVEVKVHLKQNDALPGPKLDVDGFMGSLNVFLSPRQAHLLLDLYHTLGLSGEDQYMHTFSTTSIFQTSLPRLTHLLPLYRLQRPAEMFFPMVTMVSSLAPLPPLEEPKEEDLSTSFMSSTSTAHAHVRKSARDDQSRPEIGIRLRMSSVAITILHIDPLPDPTAPTVRPTPPADSSEVLNPVNPLGEMAQHFFSDLACFSAVGFGGKDFPQLRDKFARACPHDHFRLLGTSVRVSMERRTGNVAQSVAMDVTFGQLEVLESLRQAQEPMSLLVDLQEPQYTEVGKSWQNEDKWQTEQLYAAIITYFRCLSSPWPREEISVELGRACCEVDVSLLDRLSSILRPQGLQAGEPMTSHMYMSCNPYSSLSRAFCQALDESPCPRERQVGLTLQAPQLCIRLRFPIPDLRADPERGPWFHKSLRPESLILRMTKVELKSELGTGANESQNLDISFKDLYGKSEFESSQRPIRAAHAAAGRGEWESPDNATRASTTQKINPVLERSVLEIIPNFDEVSAPGLHESCGLTDHSSPSPFSSRRVMYENEEMVMPGDQTEMADFQDKTMMSSRYVVELTLPNVHIILPGKAFYQCLYNRLNNDLLLWEPAAPLPVETVESAAAFGAGLSVASQLIHSGFGKESFTLCKSASRDEEEEEEDSFQTGEYGEDGIRHSRRQRPHQSPTRSRQSLLSTLVTVAKGRLVIHTQVKEEDDTVMEGYHGEAAFDVENSSLFSVVEHQGQKDLRFICLQGNRFLLFHKGNCRSVSPPPSLILLTLSYPPFSLSLITFLSLPFHTYNFLMEYSFIDVLLESHSLCDLLSSAHSQTCIIVRTSRLQKPINENSYKLNGKPYLFQEFLVAIAVRGATLHYRPTLPKQGWHEQVLDFIDVLDEPVLGYAPPDIITVLHTNLLGCALDYRPLYLPVRALFTAETFSVSSNIVMDTSTSILRYGPLACTHDYVCVMDMGTLPRFELSCSNDLIHIRVCSDSCALLMRLIQYFAADGDLYPPPRPEESDPTTVEAMSPGPAGGPVLADGDSFSLSDLMVDAMEEERGLTSPTIDHTANGEGFFVFVFAKDGEPVVKQLVDGPIEVHEDHFYRPLNRSDLLRPPPHFPQPEARYTLREVSIVCHLYGGRDFLPTSTLYSSGASPRILPHRLSTSGAGTRCSRSNWQAQGGPGRNQDVLMEIQLNKVQFQHEVYSPVLSMTDQAVSRQVFIVQDVEVRDRLASSQINKFLYLYTSERMPRKTYANMITIKALHVKPESGLATQECRLRISLLPLRLNIDQVSPAPQFFLHVCEFYSHRFEVFSSSIFAFSHIPCPSEFRFTSEVPIQLDYHGKHVMMEQVSFSNI
uniref:Autophagy related 2B n=1 Tax=Eptatretus burgeri TaxID=7764 RepID=A0A8C4Q9H4_EPTBU